MTPYKGSRDQRYGHISYAQHFDDGMIVNLFDLMGVEKPSYLDVGAHHPTEISNTALLYARGSRGINVEANPNLIEAFKFERPEDITVNVGIGMGCGTLPFYMYQAKGGRNTFDVAERDQWISEGCALIETKMIKVVTLIDIVHEYAGGIWPDLLTMDIEGFDYGVLESSPIDCALRSHPKIICVEVRKNLSERMKFLLGKRGYIHVCRMAENMIFVDADYESVVR